jgi:hypothetical protein
MIWPDVLFAGQLCETRRCVEQEGGMSPSFVGEFKSEIELCGQECKLGARCRDFSNGLSDVFILVNRLCYVLMQEYTVTMCMLCLVLCCCINRLSLQGYAVIYS